MRQRLLVGAARIQQVRNRRNSHLDPDSFSTTFEHVVPEQSLGSFRDVLFCVHREHIARRRPT